MATAEGKKSGGQMTVVRGLDVARYMGRWYEIASFPSFFQPRDGRDTRATYRLLEDGATVHVLNETWSKGKRDYIEGTAYKADASSDEAKLKVKFYLPPFLPIIPVVGDYWVLYVDDDYQYALVGEPRRKNLWILCRKQACTWSGCNPDQAVNRPKVTRIWGAHPGWSTSGSRPLNPSDRRGVSARDTALLSCASWPRPLPSLHSGDLPRAEPQPPGATCVVVEDMVPLPLISRREADWPRVMPRWLGSAPISATGRQPRTSSQDRAPSSPAPARCNAPPRASLEVVLCKRRRCRRRGAADCVRTARRRTARTGAECGRPMARKELATEPANHATADAEFGGGGRLCGRSRLGWSRIGEGVSRKTSIDEEVYNQLVERAKEEGYDVSKLHRTPQDDPPPESDAAPTDTKGVWWFKSLFGK